MRRFGKGLVGISVDVIPFGHHVTADLVVDEWCLGLGCCHRIDGGLQDTVFNRDALQSILGLVAVAGDHHGHRFSDEAHLIHRQ